MRRNKSIFMFNLSNIAPYLPFIIFAIIFVVGVLIGNIMVGKFDLLTSYCSDKLSEYIQIRELFDIFMVLKNSFVNIFPIYLVLFLFGTSVVGCIASPIALLLKGFGYGCISGYLYFTYKLEGIMFNALLLIPSTLISVFGLFLLAKESFNFSYMLAGICIKANKPVNIYSHFKDFCLKSLITTITALIAVLFDLGMSALFINYFNF